MVDLVETIKMCNAIKMNEITFYYHHEHISLKKKRFVSTLSSK